MQTVRVVGACLVGTGAELVTVEARFVSMDRERTEIVLTGLPDPVLRESRGRLECALGENGLKLAKGRLFLNLVPAAQRKSGVSLDLAIALGASAAVGHFDAKILRGTLFLGELGIDGRLYAVPGGLASAMAALAAGIRRVIAPPATAEEAASVAGVEVHRATHLAQVVAHLTQNGQGLKLVTLPIEQEAIECAEPSLDDVRGLSGAKTALAVAAAGGHGLLFIGPPGAGKSMLARRLTRLLPPPSLPERMEITRVLSAAGRWPGGLARTRPYRAPHHTISYAGLVGGGANVTPGEITLAHRGVLFLDELAEFRREVLEALRQPLETGSVWISRASRQVELPARFQLVAAMNPCPCGYRGHPRLSCSCPPSFVQRYRQRISGPLLDRIELCVEVSPPALEELCGDVDVQEQVRREPALTSEAELRRRIERALEVQAARQSTKRNSELGADDLDRWAPLESESRKLVATAARRWGLSARALQSIRRVARTLADLDGAAKLSAVHVAQALSLRAQRP